MVVANQTKLSRQDAWFVLRPFERYPSWNPGSEEALVAARQAAEFLDMMFELRQASQRTEGL